MNLLPKSSKEFSSKQYWNEFFSRRGAKAFEWYGEYAELCAHLHKYMKISDKILIAGCGNSSISSDLYKVGFQQITNIDISEIVIKQMKEKYRAECSKMEWIQGDLFDLKFDSESFSCVFDKGTLDALLSENSEKSLFQAQLYFEELGRVLRVGGRYICISLLQEHILESLLEWFPKRGWFMRFCRCEDAELSRSEDGTFSLPVFVVVCTKFKLLNNFKPVIEFCLREGQIDRISAPEVKESVLSLQHFSMLKYNLKNKLLAEEDIQLDLHDPKGGQKRYALYVVDAPKSSNKNYFAVFIVPHGRDNEWIFKTSKGHRQLSSSASANRLVIVHLMRDQIYGTMTDVQIELTPKVLELAPPKLPKDYKIPFLSVGDDLGERKEIFRGKSTFSGEYIVEDVKDESSNCYLRRLIFLHNQNLIQSEAKFIPDKRKKKKSNLARHVIDPSYLACSHHLVMLTSYQLTQQDGSSLLIGLGGGALASFIYMYFPKIKLTVVDIDEEIVSVAKKWFSFKTDSRLSCEVCDGITFIEKAFDEGVKYDTIMFDVDSKELSEGLSCPPKQFLDKAFIHKVSKCITDDGLFTLNLVCRDDALKESLLKDIKEVFPSIFSISIPEEVNVVLFCQTSKASKFSKDQFEKKITKLNSYLKMQTKAMEDVLELGDMLQNFQIL